ncbi:hypothetical protein QQP08_020375 [Theobroma cacao]|nr:hypothetical protein QQP08_020375 [Theobroma cacao]
MEPGEDITSMFDRFTNIANKLSQLGKPIPECELVKRLLRCLPKSWKPKVTAIREAKDLNIITLDDICCSFLTHELELKEEEEEDRKEVKEKRKSITLKASIFEEKLEELSCDDDEELALVARKFIKLMSRRNRRLTKRGHEMLFAQLDKRKGGTVSFGDDSKGRIHVIGTVGKELIDSDDYVEYGLNVYLNGKEFVMITDDLRNLLKIEYKEGEFELLEKYDPSSLLEIITGKKEKYSSKSNYGLITSPHIRILHYFMAVNIQGKSGSFSYISLQDLWLMEHAFNGVSLNLGRFMIEKMRSACRLDKVNLPYGNVITSLVQKKGIWAKRYDMNLVKTRDQAI